MNETLKEKYDAELNFWRLEYDIYQKWYNGEIKDLYGDAPPTRKEKVVDYILPINAILTWNKVHQQIKYLKDLLLRDDAFRGMRLLDVGSGPHASALGYRDCEIYCLDPLLLEYQEIGYPLHIYEERVRFVPGYSERMPFCDNFFGAVISVNALDHIENFEKAVDEIKRVLKPDGKIRLHLHYHPHNPPAHPIELNDEVVLKAFGQFNIFKISDSKKKHGHTLTNEESYTVWSNF